MHLQHDKGRAQHQLTFQISYQFEPASAQVTSDAAFTMSSSPQQQYNEATASGLAQLAASTLMAASQVPQQVWVAHPLMPFQPGQSSLLLLAGSLLVLMHLQLSS